MRYARTCTGVFVGAYRIRPTAMDAKNHCSGQPDGADGGRNDMRERVDDVFCDAWKRCLLAPERPNNNYEL